VINPSQKQRATARPILVSILFILAMATAACTNGVSEDSTQAEDVPREVGFTEAAVTSTTAAPDYSDANSTAEPIAIEQILRSNGVAPELATCYAEVLSSSGVTHASDFNELADGISALTAEEATLMNDCLSPAADGRADTPGDR